jgi:hypothetical protein
MRTKLLLIGLMATSLPGAAMAQPYDPGCVAANQQNRTAGTILGAIGGAIFGSAVAGYHNRGAGAVLGGVGGAVAGNAIAGAASHPCPPGYAYYGPPPSSAAFWSGAPGGLHARYDFVQSRIDQSARRGWISPGEANRAYRELDFIRSEDNRLRDQNGGSLRREDREYLQARLDNLSYRLNWRWS